MFSIILPLYNKGIYVEKAIRSIMDQTYNEFELIVVNDGSSDNGASLVHGLFSRLTPPLGGWKLINQPNQGVSTARNNGVNAAKYPYICFLDADDWWAPTFLEEMRILIDNYPEAGIYSCSYYKVKNNKTYRAQIGVDDRFKIGLINFYEVYAKTLCQPVWTGATIIKKDIFLSEKGFKPTLKLGEDFDLWLRIAMKYQVAFLNKPLAYYNQDVEQANRAIGKKLYEQDQYMIFSDYGNYMSDLNFRFLFEKLALYGLLKYYLAGKNTKDVKRILSDIQWEKHSLKYTLYYRIVPKNMLRLWFSFKFIGSKFKAFLINKSLEIKQYINSSSKLKKY